MRPGSDLARLVGQLIVGRYAGARPDASFLRRVRAGQLGAVILFGDNTAAGLSATRRAIAELQRAAREGRNPPLLVMTDQEGGEVRRLPGPPTLAPADMDSVAVAEAQGADAGRLLRSVGINVDLAPVADVERVPGSFLGTRSFGSDQNVVAARACAFARGLASAGVLYTLKHFPGLGRATADTDAEPVTIDASAPALRGDYAAYRRCGASPDALVMVSSASYPALSGRAPAVTAPEIYSHELPLALGQAGHLTISDALDTPALAGEEEPAVRAVRAGLDLAMFPGNQQESASAYARLLAAARSGEIPDSRLRSAAYAVEALKRRLR
jgi:beta-N-acetylhexosaminidase